MWTKQFWFDLMERGSKTAAQAVILGLGLGEGFNAFAVDWQLGLGFALGGFILSALTSIASGGFGVRGTASLTNTGYERV